MNSRPLKLFRVHLDSLDLSNVGLFYLFIYLLFAQPASNSLLLVVSELIFVTKILKINEAAILEGALFLEILCIMIAVKVIKACSDTRQQT